jgi:cysteinyl-tRNA synthetase
MKFLEMMDDDFNTAGAIGVMHELAGEINGYIEKNRVEQERPPDMVSAASAATQTLRKLGLLLGLFRKVEAKRTESAAPSGLAEGLMELIIQLRADVRKRKDFATADAIRDGLAKLGITLEDRPAGTGWRKE